MSVVIVYGEQGSGKSQLVEPLSKMYQLENVVEEWDNLTPSLARFGEIPGGCLVLTNAADERVQAPGVIWLSVDEAKALVAKVHRAA